MEKKEGGEEKRVGWFFLLSFGERKKPEGGGKKRWLIPLISHGFMCQEGEGRKEEKGKSAGDLYSSCLSGEKGNREKKKKRRQIICVLPSNLSRLKEGERHGEGRGEEEKKKGGRPGGQSKTDNSRLGRGGGTGKKGGRKKKKKRGGGGVRNRTSRIV